MSSARLNGDPALSDRRSQRLTFAAITSVALNLILWRTAAAIAAHPPQFDLRPVEISRVILAEKRVPQPKIAPHELKPRTEPIHPAIVRPVRPTVQVPKTVKPNVPGPRPTPAPPPEGAHNRVITATDKAAALPDDPGALKGGNADLGKPADTQAPGNARANPEKPAPTPAAVPQPIPKPVVAPAPAPVHAPVVKPAPMPAPMPAPIPEPVKPAPAKPRGPSRDAEPSGQVNPEIPDDLKRGNYRSFVRVKIEVDVDGSFTPILRTSSGNAEIDSRVLDALKRWKWAPALRDGVPVKSIQLFKFDFLVE